MPSLNNNQMASILNDAIAMSTGAQAVGTLDLQGIIDAGNDPTVIGAKDQFCKALNVVMVGRWYTDSSYRSQFQDLFYQDAQDYGAILAQITVEIPEAQESHAWQDFGQGVGQVSTVGTYSVMVPVVHEQLYGLSNSWEIAITITDEQFDQAFHNADELANFVSRIYMAIDNGIVVQLERMSENNRNNFIAEKFAYAASLGATGIHVVDVIDQWATHSGATSNISVEDFRNNPDALKWFSMQLKLYSDYFTRMNTLFNTAGYKRFTPKDRQVIQVLSLFEADILANVDSDTYHKEIVELPGHQSVPFWQGCNSLAFDDVSHIDVEIGSDGTAVDEEGIVACIIDKWACMHTIWKRRTAVKVFEPEALRNVYNQFRESYTNNLTMQGVVFQLKDWTAPTP